MCQKQNFWRDLCIGQNPCPSDADIHGTVFRIAIHPQSTGIGFGSLGPNLIPQNQPEIPAAICIKIPNQRLIPVIDFVGIFQGGIVGYLCRILAQCLKRHLKKYKKNRNKIDGFHQQVLAERSNLVNRMILVLKSKIAKLTQYKNRNFESFKKLLQGKNKTQEF
jgi:hypothetical protein